MLVSVLFAGADSAWAANASATFIGVDSETQGNWKGVYGKEGFNIYDDVEAYPSYAEVTITGANGHTWESSSTDVRALERAEGNDRLSAVWYITGVITFDLNLTDGHSHQVALYLYDWDRNARIQLMEILDAETGEVLDTQEASDYGEGKYLVWHIRGHVQIRATHIAGYNAIVSALFFDSALQKEQSHSPNPVDEQSDVLRDSQLNWAPGDFAVKHDVYFGAVYEDVNDADQANPMDALVSPEQDATTFDPGRLDFGQTYYWRVDEVNGAPDRTVFKGEVWRFTVEPLAIPVETITATASSSSADNMGPENTINRVGLDELDQHSTEPTDMWLSGMGDVNPSIQYAFDKAYKLDEMRVWNSNQVIEAFVGIGAKDVTVEHSLDGAEWTVLEGATQFAQAPGAADYVANTSVDFGGALAQYVKITVKGGYGMLPQYGLSAVRFMYIPTFAREPQPADGETSEAAHVVLSWRAGREAATHEVYLGTDPADLALVATTDAPSFLAEGLDYDQRYYWQVVEINEAETPSAHAGPVWQITTPAYGTVDSFDLYDDDCKRIFFAWEDGLGHNGGEDVDNCDMAPSNGNGGGSIVGNASSPFAEQTIVYAGSQSLPLEYDNAFGASEATLALDGQNWTSSGVQTLSIMFFGAAGNSGQLYVKINNTKVLYDGAVDDIQKAQWQPWNIDLSSVGANLQNVTRLAIGIDGANAAGKLYIDEIRLYPKAGELVIPVEPDNTDLVASYALDGDLTDSSGQGNNGTLVGNATYDAGVSGQAISFNGVDSYVDIADDPSLDLDTSLTIAAWVNLHDLDTYYFIAHKGPSGTAGDNYPGNFALRISPAGILQVLHQTSQGQTFATYNSSAAITARQWCHVAGTLTKGESVEFYINGRRAGSAAQETEFGILNDISVKIGGRTDNYSFFNGAMDDVRIYNRALAQAELAWLAGKTDPMQKPF